MWQILPLSFGKTILGLVCGASLWAIAFSPPSSADYQPPDDASAPSGSRSSSGARRGCLDQAGSMMILAPRSHVGRTASTQPTVSWFIPDAEVFEMELHLYELDNGDGLTLLKKQEMQTSPGFMQASLSNHQLELVPGRRYLWRVVVLCNPNRPSSALVDEAEMVVVPPSLEVQDALEDVTRPAAQAAIYAEAGLWYDAFAQAAAAQSPEDEDYRQQLLRSLAEIELSASSANQSFGEQLQELLTP